MKENKIIVISAQGIAIKDLDTRTSLGYKDSLIYSVDFIKVFDKNTMEELPEKLGSFTRSRKDEYSDSEICDLYELGFSIYSINGEDIEADLEKPDFSNVSEFIKNNILAQYEEGFYFVGNVAIGEIDIAKAKELTSNIYVVVDGGNDDFWVNEYTRREFEEFWENEITFVRLVGVRGAEYVGHFFTEEEALQKVKELEEELEEDY